SGHFGLDTLIAKLEKKHSVKSWTGIGQIFVANIDEAKSSDICREGLLYLFRMTPQNFEVFNIIENIFRDEAKYPHITSELATAYLDALPIVENAHGDLHGFLGWLAYRAQGDP